MQIKNSWCYHMDYIDTVLLSWGRMNIFCLHVYLIQISSNTHLHCRRGWCESVLSHGGRRHSVTKDHNQYIMYVCTMCVWDTYNETNSRKRRWEKKKGNEWMTNIYAHLLSWSQETAKLIRAATAAAGGQYHYRVRIFYAVRDGFRSHVNRFVIFTTTRWR